MTFATRYTISNCQSKWRWRLRKYC